MQLKQYTERILEQKATNVTPGKILNIEVFAILIAKDLFSSYQASQLCKAIAVNQKQADTTSSRCSLLPTSFH